MFGNARKCLKAALLGSVFAVVFLPAAVAKDEPAAKPKTGAASPEALKVDVSLNVWKRTRSFQRLERAIFDGVKLDESQKSLVKSAFEALYTGMRENPNNARRYPQTYRVLSEDERMSREADLAAAEKAGNEKLVREIKADIAKHTAGTDENFTRIPEDIVGELRPLLKDPQKADYERVAARWTALEVGGPFEGPVRMLIRCVKDPELKLNPTQRLAAETILGETMLAVRKNRDPQNIAELAAKARLKLRDELTNEQRDHMEKTLQMFVDELQLVRVYAEKWFASRGRAVPSEHYQPIPWEKAKKPALKKPAMKKPEKKDEKKD